MALQVPGDREGGVWGVQPVGQMEHILCIIGYSTIVKSHLIHLLLHTVLEDLLPQPEVLVDEVPTPPLRVQELQEQR